MKKDDSYRPNVGEPVRIKYLEEPNRQEIGIYLRTDSEHYVFSSLKYPDRKTFVSRNHTTLEKLETMVNHSQS